MTTTRTAPTSQRWQGPWWMTLIRGILALTVGSVLLFSLLKSQVNFYLALVQLLGIWWMVEGILDIVAIFIDASKWGLKLFIGTVSFLAGGYILMYPIAAAILLPKIAILLLGIWGLMYGILLLVLAFQGGGWVSGIIGVLGIIFGFAMITNYYSTDKWLSIIWVAAWFALIGGIALIVKAFGERSVPKSSENIELK